MTVHLMDLGWQTGLDSQLGRARCRHQGGNLSEAHSAGTHGELALLEHTY